MDVARLRKDTPGCERVLHFNNAGASLTPRPVLEAVKAHLDLETRIGGYEAEAAASERLAAFYTSAAALVGGQPDEIAFVENATRAWDMAFYSMPWRLGDRILTAQAAYLSNALAFLHISRRAGVIIDVVPNDASGQVDVEALESMITADTRLIALTHVPTNGGLINPAEAVGEVASRHGLPYLLDACQSLGQMPIDVGQIQCTMLSGTGRKYLRGPRGTGLLWIRRDWIDRLDPVMIDGRAAAWTSRDDYALRKDARRFECWESYVAGRLGLATAIDYALEIGLDAIEARVQKLAVILREGLGQIDGVKVRDLGVRQCGIVTFTADWGKPARIKAALNEAGINVSVTTVESARYDMEPRGLGEMVRASVHCYNTEAEVGRFVGSLGRLG